MESFQAFAHPWWVNLLLLVPAAAYFGWRRTGLELTLAKKLTIAAFALAFGFVEAAVVVYLHTAEGILPALDGAQAQSLNQFPPALLKIEIAREAATMLMLVSTAWLAAPKLRERWASFLWAFAIWDITYYAGLWVLVGWPASLKEIDVLFLIPVPWVAQVWYPLLVSALTILAVSAAKMPPRIPVAD